MDVGYHHVYGPTQHPSPRHSNSDGTSQWSVLAPIPGTKEPGRDGGRGAYGNLQRDRKGEMMRSSLLLIALALVLCGCPATIKPEAMTPQLPETVHRSPSDIVIAVFGATNISANKP